MKKLELIARTEKLEVKEKLASLMKEARKEIEAIRGWYNSTAEGVRKPISMNEMYNIMYEISRDEFPILERWEKAPD